jgi:putative hydrolase of the HAD superfamily
VSRAILFDVDGVLIHGFHTREDRRRRWDAHLKADLGVDPVAFQERFIRQSFIADVINGRASLINKLETVLPSLGYKGSAMSFASYWLARDTQLNQPLLEAIRTLRAGGRIGPMYIATNQEHLRAFYLWSTLGLQHLFDDIFYAARLGASKPDRAFFVGIMDRIGPQDEPPLMVDDNGPVVDAARTFGWEAIQYDDLEDFTQHPWVAERLVA